MSGIETKYVPGSMTVGKTLMTKDLQANNLNGIPIKNYVTTSELDNLDILQGFGEDSGGEPTYKGSPIGGNGTGGVEREYTAAEAEAMVESLWAI
jgi:hypothetical protein